jgi:hypothetical protein
MATELVKLDDKGQIVTVVDQPEIIVPKTLTVQFSKDDLSEDLPLLVESIKVRTENHPQFDLTVDRLIVARDSMPEGEASVDIGGILFKSLEGGGWEVNKTVTKTSSLLRMGVKISPDESLVYENSVVKLTTYEINPHEIIPFLTGETGGHQLESPKLSDLEVVAVNRPQISVDQNTGQKVMKMQVVYKERAAALLQEPTQYQESNITPISAAPSAQANPFAGFVNNVDPVADIVDLRDKKAA